MLKILEPKTILCFEVIPARYLILILFVITDSSFMASSCSFDVNGII